MKEQTLKELYTNPPVQEVITTSGPTVKIPNSTQIKHPQAIFHHELVSSKQCRVYKPGTSYICTRTKGHIGVHAAHYSNGTPCPIKTWVQGGK